MVKAFEAAWQLHQFLQARDIPYMIIGGIAVQRWGEPRFTRYLDALVLCEPGSEGALIDELLAHFEGRIEDAAEFARKHRVLLLRIRRLTDVDVSFGLPGYEEQALERAVSFDIGNGRTVNICSPEDLVVSKLVTGRSRDLTDAEGVVRRNWSAMDLGYVRHCLKEFSQALDMPELLATFAHICDTIKEEEERLRKSEGEFPDAFSTTLTP